MSKIGSLLKEEILRLARKEVRGEVRAVKRASAQYRRDIAGLKRQLRTVTTRLARAEKHAVQTPGTPSAAAAQENLRFSAKGLRSHRKRLGLSAGDYSKLVGVTPLSIYNWERGVARPRPEWLKALASMRSLSKRDAKARLEKLSRKPVRRRRRA